MFSADLSWTDGTVEKVGERRERKEAQRANSVSSSNSSSNGRQSSSWRPSTGDKTSLASITGSFRRPSFTKGRSIRKPNIASIDLRKYSLNSRQQHHKVLPTVPSPTQVSGGPIDTELPPWGTSPDVDAPAVYEDAVCGGNFKSTISSDRRSSQSEFGHHWAISVNDDSNTFWSSYQQTADKIVTLNGSRPETFLSNTSSTKVCLSEVPPDEEECELFELPSDSQNGIPSPRPRSPLRPTHTDAQAQGGFYLRPTPLEDLPAILQTVTITVRTDSEVEEEASEPAPKAKSPPPNPIHPSTKSHWQAPSDWEIVRDTKKESQKTNGDDSAHSTHSGSSLATSTSLSSNGIPADRSTTAAHASSHFQRFIRRMEGAGPKIILDRLREEWSESTLDDGLKEELALEKHLWALTALQLSAIVDQFMKPGLSPGLTPGAPLPPNLKAGRRRKILELDGAIGEIYQLSAMYPDSSIAHLVCPSAKAALPLPSQARQHPLPSSAPTASTFLPLPYATSSMHHIRSSRLASLVPSSELPRLLSECHRVLKPGGVLELRLIDAAPPRQCLGPELAAWLDERLLLGLEAGFRCSRPLALIPQWVKQAGFAPLPSMIHDFEPPNSLKRSGLVRCLRLPAATPATPALEKRAKVVTGVGVLLARALWKDIWGPYVIDAEEGEKWWWDADCLLGECEEWGTVWEVGTLVVVKEA